MSLLVPPAVTGSVRRQLLLRLIASAASLSVLVVPAAASAATRTVDRAPYASIATDGAVKSIARDGGTVFFGGGFSRVGKRTGPGVVVDPSSGAAASG